MTIHKIDGKKCKEVIDAMLLKRKKEKKSVYNFLKMVYNKNKKGEMKYDMGTNSNDWNITCDDVSNNKRRIKKMEEQVVINKTERPNSYEVGKAGNRFKLYFSDAQDLENLINELKEKKLWGE